MWIAIDGPTEEERKGEVVIEKSIRLLNLNTGVRILKIFLRSMTDSKKNVTENV